MIVDYMAQGDTTSTSPITIGGITATETNGGTLALSSSVGLGGVGGSFLGGYLIDFDESVLFQFEAGPAIDVLFLPNATATGPPSNINVEGFGASGASWGIVTFVPQPGTFDVWAAFAGAELSGFRVAGNGMASGISVATITYSTEVVAAVPEPASLAILASGVPIGLVALRRRRW